MDKTYKICFFFVAFLLEVVLFYLWRLDGDKWSLWDKSFCIFVICCHIPFYFALYFDNRPWLDILHITIFISTLFGIFINNINLLLLIFIFLIGVQVQWICMNKCILNSDEQNNNTNLGFGKLTSIATLLYTCFLMFKIGKKSAVSEKEIEKISIQ